jgi:signal transduction histidine kinase
MNQKLNFKTNVLLKSIIGKDLINDDNIAILELVKNSFDAGSPIVNVIFKNIKVNDDFENENYTERTSKIIIQDLGKGMNNDDIENKWLNIAYSEKKNKKEDNNRIFAGNKGVGRFSCDRLGQFLDLYTKTKTDNSYFHLKINWNDFETEKRKDLNEKEKEKLEIQQINVLLTAINKNEFEQTTGYKPFEEGVILEISKLRNQWAVKEKKKKDEYWNVDKLLKLRNYLEKLINPNQIFQKTKFETQIIANEFINDSNEVNGIIKNKIFDKLSFTATCIDSTIDSKGETIFTSITDKGRIIFMLEEKNVNFGILKDIRVFLYYLNTYSKIYFTRQTGIRSVDFGSVFLFVNGFMIPPYGESGNDWLGLEIRKGQGNKRNISTRELVGRIEINDFENKFRIISSREGVANDDPFLQLTQSAEGKKNKKDGFFYYTFKRLEKYVVDGLKWDKITGDEELEIEESLSKKRAKIITEFENLTESISAKDSTKFEKYYESELDKKKRVFSIIQNIINVKNENIIDLYINEDLIFELVEEEKKVVQKNIKKLLSSIDELDYKDIESELIKIEKDRQSLKNIYEEIQSFSAKSINTKTVDAILNSRTIFENFENSYLTFYQTAKKLAFDKKKFEDQLLKEKEEKEIKDAELSAEKQKNSYLLATRRTLSEDADGILHTVKDNSILVRDGIDNLIDDITYNNISNEKLKIRLVTIKGNVERSLKLAEIATWADFKKDIDEIDVDIIEHFYKYIEVYKETYNSNDIIFEFVNYENKFVKRVSVLNLSIVIDNLFTNAIRWKAKNIKIIFNIENSSTLTILVSDSGLGLSEKYLKIPEKIFELGVGDTPPNSIGGSGIGLYYSRKLLNSMNADIKFVGNNKILKGATFEIVFN